MLDYKYHETEVIRKRLIELAAVRLVFNDLKTVKLTEESLRRKSLLKSSVFSARIEGNQTPLSGLENKRLRSALKEKERTEIFNLLSAYKYINSKRAPQSISLKLIRSLHTFVMRGLSVKAGKWRNELWAVFDQAGVAVYVAPPPEKVGKLMGDFVATLNALKYSPPENAGLTQYLFEKIHPFADGNGRVGRLLSSFILKNGSYDFRGLAPFEEYLERHRSEYYRVLEPSRDATAFIGFFLAALVYQSRELLEQLKNNPADPVADGLLPRRREIYLIIKDHPYSSFDFIGRRFRSVNPKTLHYDLLKLQKSGLVTKIGISRGSVYKASHK